MAAVRDVGVVPVSAMRAGCILLALLWGVEARAAEQRVTFRLSWDEKPGGSVVVMLHARDATGSAKPVEMIVSGDQASTVLPAGQWVVHASSPGYWGEPRLVSVTDGPTEATLALYRSTRLFARITTPARGAARAVDVHFNPIDPTSRQPRGSTTCPVTEGQLECELPAGLYDLAFRIAGHASLYRWDVDLRTSPSLDAGKLAFRRGDTLSGQVKIGVADGSHSLARVEVSLRPSGGHDRNDALRERQGVTGMHARPNARGFFSFDVRPGRYVVVASSPGLVSEEREVTVIEGREAVLGEPLVLERLATLVVNVQLPAEGSKMPWKLALIRFDADGNATEDRVLSVPVDGVCRFENEMSGSYNVELRIRDSVWAAESFYLDGDRTVDMRVSVARVRGSIRLGDTPLQAQLRFVSREKGLRIPVRSRADGSFRLFLPDHGTNVWEEVEIESRHPLVTRVIESVPLDRDGDGLVTVDLRLPDNRIDGRVVDEMGNAVGEGLVNLTTPDGFRQIEMTDGTFTINGLQPGRYAITAATRELETEDPLYVDLPNGGGTKRDVVVKVGPVAQLRGSVASLSGPVIGASVFVGAANAAHPITGTIPVDLEGAFDFRLPPQTREIDVAVAAPGFAFRMMRLPVPKAKMDIVVDQNGGVLTVDGGVTGRKGPLRPYLLHNGAILNGFAAAYVARGRLLADPEARVHFEIPSAEEGGYTLCLLSLEEERSVRLGGRAPETRCVSGVLARHGSLTLRTPEVRQN